MKRPENIIDNGEYNEPNCFESDQEAVLFYAYLEQEKYIDEITKQLTLTDVVKPFTPTQILKVLDDCNGLIDAKEYFLDENL
mgnify:CR=1 FL=1